MRISSIVCQECNEPFKAARSDAKYCPKCRSVLKARWTKESCERHKVRRRKRHREEQRKYREQHRDEINRWRKERYATDEEFRERLKAHAREWWSVAGHATATRAKRRKTTRKWYVQHRRRLIDQRVESQRAQKFKGKSCRVCGADDPRVLVVHHKKPVAKGGTSVKRNLETLCRNCHAIVHFEIEANPQGTG